MIQLTTKSSWRKLAFVFILAEILNFSAQANPGDTTVVTVWNLRKLTQYGNYDTTAIFPTGKRYRKIRMHYILGRYACPGNPQYCGSWDYTTQIYARPTGKDTVEIGRVITPYATDWQGLNKKHDYIMEVTDYASVLDGSTGMRFNYSGYSWGFTITLKIEFIEGIPPMDAVKVRKIYDGYFPFGNATNSIENYLTPKTFSYTAPTNKVYIRNTVSGHGSDNAGCSEFCSKYYQLNINNTMLSQKQLWRTDCGENQVYPQTGTWVYNRGNWCPGAIVWPIYHNITPNTSANTNFTVNIDMQPYTIASASGGYNYVTHLVEYKVPNNSRDVSIEDIIAPTNDDNFIRQNSRCSNPVIKIRNTGTDTVKSIVFSYGLKNGTPLTYTWTGSLAFLETQDAVFPPSASILSTSVSAVFQVSVVSVNNSPSDDNVFNNIYKSTTMPVSVFPKSFVVRLLTNNLAAQNYWTLYDENDIAVVSSGPMNNTTLYRDTISNLPPGCYRLRLDDSGCDGLYWWANTNQGSGSMALERTNAPGLIFSYPVDFGCNFTKYFYVLPDPAPPVDTTGIARLDESLNSIEVFPNPAQTLAYLKLDLNKSQNVTYSIADINGRVIRTKTLNNVDGLYETIDIASMSEGVYLVTIKLQDHSTVTRKLVVQK
ncbi:MAG: peptide-N-glycosidase F-related protein [bacterium]|nr:peptide-N-glycosidase F-related protein [bacterium]